MEKVVLYSSYLIQRMLLGLMENVGCFTVHLLLEETENNT